MIYRIVINGLICSLPIIVMVVWPYESQAAESENIIKYRQAVMKSQGGHMAAAAEIVKAKVDFASDLAYHAAALAASTKGLARLFPAGSDFGETRAKAEIWSKRSEFDKAANDAEKAGSAFLAAVSADDKAAIGKAFGDLAEACKGCHKRFREKKE